MSSKGQNQLLQAALKARKQAAEDRVRHLPANPESLEEKQPTAQPIVVEKDDAPIAEPITEPIQTIVKPDKDLADTAAVAVATPQKVRKHVEQVSKKFEGNLVDHPSIKETLQEHFGKVQVGEERIIVGTAKGHLVKESAESVMEFIEELFLKADLQVDVYRSRTDRYRIITK